MVELFSQRREKVTDRATKTLSKIAKEHPEVVVSPVTKRLKRALAGDELIMSIRMLELLSHLGPAASGAVDELMSTAQSETETLSYWAVHTLGKIGPSAEQAIPLLTELSTGKDSFLRPLALKALQSIATGEELAKAIEPALKSDYPKARRKAIDIVQELGPKAKTTVPVLLNLLEKEGIGIDTRERIISALGAVGNPDTIPALIQRLKAANTHDRIKIASADALHSIGDPAPEALKPLLNLADRADSEQKKIIANTIKTIKTSNVPPQVQQVNLDCIEGRSVVIEFPITDKDDIEAGIKVDVTRKPDKGNITRKGPRTFKYESEYGHPGRYILEWTASDALDTRSVAEAVIQVKPDTTPPKLVGAYALTAGSRIKAMFNEPVTRKTAENADNYSVQGGEVKKALSGELSRIVFLVTSQLEEGKSYTLGANGIQDRSKAGNRSQGETIEFEPGMVFYNFEAYPHGTTPEGIESWSRGKDSGICQVDARKFSEKQQGHVMHMDVNSDDDWQDVLVQEFEQPLRGHYQFEYKFWEPVNNHDGNLWLRGADGKFLLGAGTENPQWEVVIRGKGEVVNDGGLGNDYEHWIRVAVEVDTTKNRARVTFDDTADKDKKTYGWFDLPETNGIGAMGIGPDAIWFVDDIGIQQLSEN